MEHIGPYEVRGSIGRGGMGVVVRAWDPRLNREVAIKLLNTAGATDAQRERFRREATAQARLRHPHIAAVHDVGEHERQAFIVMDLVQGESLDARLERQGPLAPRVAADLVRKLARAIAHAHENGILHRDLKPANVLLTPDLEPILVDFGLAKHLGGNNASLSRQGAFLGTPGYWPPEQAGGQLDRIGPPADVYGLGALLYASLTGRAPHVGDTLIEVLVAVRQLPEPPSTVREGIPPELDAVCLRCLATDPDARYHSSWELAEDLEAFVRGEPLRVVAARPEAPAAVDRRSRGAVLGVGVVALAVTLVAVLLAIRRPPGAEQDAPGAPEAVASVPTRVAADPIAPAPQAAPIVPEATQVASWRSRLEALVAASAASGDEAAEAAVDAALEAQFGDRYALEADLQRVEALVLAGELASAGAWLDAAVARHPRSLELLRRRGHLALERLQFASARVDLEKAFSSGGGLEVGLGLGRALAGTGAYDDALEHLSGLTEPGTAGASSADAWTARGETALVAGGPLARDPASSQRFDAAAAFALDRALELDGSHVVALLARARLRRVTGVVALGRQDAERARALLAAGKDRGAWLDAVVTAALLALEAGDLSAARARYDEALEAAPAHAPALAGLGHLELTRGDPSRGAALAARARSARLDPAASSEASRLLRAAARCSIHDGVAADALLARALLLDPFFSEALLARARRAREPAFARRLLERAVEVDPTSAEAHERLGCLLEASPTEGARAADAFEASSSAATTDLERARAQRGVAAARLLLGDLDAADEALAAAEEALSGHGPPDVQTLPIALACAGLGTTVCERRSDALGAAAVEERRRDLQAFASALVREGLRAAKVLRGAERHEEAIARLDQVIALAPDLGAAWLARGSCYVDVGNFVPGLLDVFEAGRLDPSLADPVLDKAYSVSYVLDLGRVEAEIKRVISANPGVAAAASLVPAYTLGKTEFKKFDEADVDAGLAGADRTLELDPRFVLALDARALLLLKRSLFASRPPADALADLDAAERDVARALELAPRLAFTHYVAASLAARRAVCGPAVGAAAAATLAVDRLSRAVECGLRGHERLRSDRVFDVLRATPRFEALVADLEAKFRGAPEEAAEGVEDEGD